VSQDIRDIKDMKTAGGPAGKLGSGGIVVVNKEKGYTSMDVVACIRGIFHTKKAGHTGTLDPDATGVLPVCIGPGTQLVSMMTDSDKTYRAVMKLGVVTDTQDISGNVLEEHGDAAMALTPAEVEAAVRSFEGGYDQVPPMYSAIKIGGKKLVDLARQGRVVEREPRPIKLYRIEIGRIELPYVEMTVECSKGTYIRTLCHDIGQRFGCGACMTQLVREKAAGFTIARASTLKELEQARDAGTLEDMVIGMEEYFSFIPAHTVAPEQDKYVLNGNKLAGLSPELCGKDGMVRIYTSDGAFRAVYRYDPATEEYRVAVTIR
jgi:tRNA pseudouridine55 synthase